MSADTKDKIYGIGFLVVVAAILIAGGVGIGRTTGVRFPDPPCKLNTDQFEVTDSSGVRWGQLDRAIVGCSAQGISVLVPKP